MYLRAIAAICWSSIYHHWLLSGRERLLNSKGAFRVKKSAIVDDFILSRSAR